MADQAFINELNRWSEMLLELNLIEAWCEGAIFPREMAFFMAHCQVVGVEQIIESGRQDGYSTRILGEFARRTGIVIVSIDYEDDKARGERCRQMLAPYTMDILTGDAFEEIGRVLKAKPMKTAVLIDGPKNWGAVSLLCASASFRQVAVISMHNLDEGYNTRPFFADLADEPVYYEEYLEGYNEGAWARLSESEISFASSQGAARGGKRSTIGVLSVEHADRDRIANASSGHFRTYPPKFVRWAWQTGNFGLLKLAFSATNRWLGPEQYHE